MNYDTEVSLRSKADGTLVASVEVVDITEEGAPMALTRAVAGLCTTVGFPTPEQLFREAAVLRVDNPHQASELTAIDLALAQRGFDDYSGAQGVACVLDHLIAQSFAGVMGPDAEHALREAREAYRMAALAAQDIEAHHLAGKKKDAEPAQVAAMMRATSALGALLHLLRGVSVMPSPQAAEGDVEVTGERGGPC